MSSITTIQSTDLITNSRAVINTNFSNLNTDKMETSVLDTDTTLAANSDSKVATQKAVKAYVDGVGVANASTTVRGVVEEALDAEVVAGTDTGATGARLFVPPSKLNTQIDAKIAANLPAFQQAIAMNNSTDAVAEATMRFCSGSDASGSTLFVSTGITNLARYARDSVTGTYRQTHHIDPAFTYGSNSDFGGIIVIGSYMYLFSNDGTNIACSRFLAADLTGETSMTVPVVACTSQLVVWTDGTDAYIVSSASDTTSRRWTVSGTTFSAASTATISSGLFLGNSGTSMSDGTNYYVVSKNTNDFNIFKMTTADGTSRTSTQIVSRPISDISVGVVLLNIGTTRMYWGYLYTTYNATAVMASLITLYPVTKP